MRILFLQPCGNTLRGLPAPPYAVMYVAAIADTLGHEVKILDRNLETDTRKIIDTFKPDLFCVTSLTGPMITDAMKVCRYVRRTLPGVPIMWGGIHCSLLPDQTLRHELVDFIVIGEGEETFREFLEVFGRGDELSGVKGIGYKLNGIPVINDRRPFLSSLDDLPLAPWHLIDYSRYLVHETLFLTSRGCPHRCAFCYNENYYFRKWRAMSASRVIKEIEHARSYHPIHRYRFDDDNFTVNKERFYDILKSLPSDASIYFETRVDYVDEKMCQVLTRFRDVFVFLGLESGDAEMLVRYCKDVTLDQVHGAFELFHQYHIKTSASFVIGAPGEIKAQVDKTMALARHLRPTRYGFCIYTPYPGSLFYAEISKGPHASRLPASLDEWGCFSSAESTRLNFSLVSDAYLKKLYNNAWWHSIRAYVRDRQFNWLLIGMLNALRIFRHRFLQFIHKDIF